MPEVFADPTNLIMVLGAALAAGFVTGFAGFGTGLVASGLWFHALPATMIPPMVAITSVAGQLVGLVMVRKAFDWRQTRPYLLGGVIGVPLGVWVLSLASPLTLKSCVGAFLVGYSLFQLTGAQRASIGQWGGRQADAAIGVGGGFLGGFAGLSGPLPLIWLQLRGGPSSAQRATYQPFNLIVLMLASVVMAASGQITKATLIVTAACLPFVFAGAWLGARLYSSVSDAIFRKVVLFLLLTSGIILIAQTVL